MGKQLIKTVVFMVSIFIIVTGHAESLDQCENWVAKVAAVSGKIEARRYGQKDWAPVYRNNTYCSGDQIRASISSKATLVFINETLVTLDENSAIFINKIKSDGFSILELIKGIAHFISRVPRSLKIKTPFVNAVIEGTEFIVDVGNNETRITVFEGTVLTKNTLGELRITNNETSKAGKGEAPTKVIMVNPRDAVKWAIYFPPISKGKTGSEHKAQSVINAIVNNQDNALMLAQETVSLFPDAASSYMALSYAWQSKFNLPQALSSAATATEKEPENAIAWARLAEMQLSVGKIYKALLSAQKSNQLDTDFARAQTILGYIYLTQINIRQAQATFNKAIELNQSDPLPHLGLGLAMIRNNQLPNGRREIEIAAALDPNNSIIRSYLGKAYYQEKRAPLDADQFEMAKVLDPNDPTPYFYDAIRKYAENNPVGALRDLNASIELNDNRAVYRSSLQLDQDEAVRNVGVAKIYNAVSFDFLSLLEAGKSVNNDPTNHSAHRFLAESYAVLPRHQIAQESQLLQAKMFDPLITSPIQLLYTQPDLPIQIGNVRLKQTINDNSIFTHNGLKTNADAIFGNNNTVGENVSVAGIYDKFSFSLGQLNYKTDGYRVNNDQDHKLLNLLAQYNLTPDTMIQFEWLNKKSEYGDIESRFDLTKINENDRFKFNEDTIRIGLRHNINNRSTLLFSLTNSKENNDKVLSKVFENPPDVIKLDRNSDSNADSDILELQYFFINESQKIILGAGVFNQKDLTASNLSINSIPLSTEVISHKIEHTNYYIYDYLKLHQFLLLTLGLSYDDFKDNDLNGGNDVVTNKFNTKIGLEWDVNNNLKLRFASFSTFKRPLLSNQTLEPTQIAGFNQFFDDLNAAESDRYGVGFDFKYSKKIFSGIELTQRKIKITESLGGIQNQDEILHRLYFYWTPSASTALSAEYTYDKYKNIDNNLADTPSYLETQTLPIRFSYFFGLIYTSFTATYVDQSQELLQASGSFVNDNDDFITVDIETGYKFKSRTGHIGLYINNLFGKEFSYRDRNFQFTADHISKYIPERTIFINLNLNF